jgi:hypothetical protein
VDDVRMGEFFHSSVENMVQNEIADIHLDVLDNTNAISELRTNLENMTEIDIADRDTSTGLTPEEFHTLVADIAKEIARGEICVALADAHKKMQARLNGEA